MAIRSVSLLGAAIVSAGLSRDLHGQAGTVLGEFRIGEGLGGFTGTLADNVEFGAALASLGDLDGDGLDEVAVGMPGGDNGRGALWILFLRADGTVRNQVRIAQGVGGFTGTLASNARFGASLCALGDFDLDGTPDLAVGSWLAEAWILLLRPDGTVETTTRAAYGSGASQPRAPARLGDLDGDGLPELVAGEPNSGQGGSAWILYLQANGSFRTKVRIPTPHAGESGTLAPGTFGSSAAPLGDLDGDGVLDMAVGDPYASDGELQRGAVWLFFLRADGAVKSRRRLGQGARGFRGALDPADQFGSALAAHDLDLDGDLELCICAQGDDDGQSDGGAAWLCFLGADGRVERERKISMTAGGFSSDLSADFARSATFCDDLDGNGGAELLLGAPDAFSPDQLSGVTWMLSLAGPSGTSELPLEPLVPGVGVGRSGPRLFVVDPECGNASRIDTAVAAARDGDVIVVRAGDHAPFTIENKALRVICEPGVRTGTIVVRGLSAQREVVLRGIEGTLVLEDNLGPIWIEDSLFLTTPERTSRITRCAQVGLFECVFSGTDSFAGFCGANGGSVLRVSESTVFAYDCEWTGMAGCPATLDDGGCLFFGCETTAATPGASALTLVNSSAYLFGCTLQGGAGGAGLVYGGSCAWCPATMPAAADGSGIARDAGSELTLMASTLSSLTGTGPTTYLGGDPSSFDVSTPVVPGEPVTLHITGTPGHEAYVLAGSPYQPAFDGARSGVAVLPPATPATFLGVLPASGSLTVVLSLNLLAGREQAEVLYHQALTVDPTSGASTLGAPSVLLQYRDPCP